jgi:uncharacterized membrane protein YbhN (UPF0104 family)
MATINERAKQAAAPEADVENVKATRSLRRGLISLALLVVLVTGLVLAVPGLRGIGRAVTEMHAGWLVVAVILEVLSCLGYVVAFLQVFERAPIRFGARVALSELAFGAAVPIGGVGSAAVGAWLLVERGGRPARVAERSAVLFLVTSAINVITLLLAAVGLFVGILPGPSNPLLSILPAAVSAAVLAFFLALPRMLERGAGHEAPGRVRFVLNTIDESVRDTRRLLFRRDWRILGAIGFLWFDIGVLVACFAAEGVHPPLASIVLAYQIAYLSNLIPVPGGIGVLDGSFIGLLVLYGVNATSAAAATLVYHTIALWIPAMWGTVAFLVLRHNRNEPLVLRPPRNAPRGSGSERGEVHRPADGVGSEPGEVHRPADGAGSEPGEVHSDGSETGSERGLAPPAD